LLDEAAITRKALRRGEALFTQGDTFHALYAVRSGCLKSVMVDENGAEQVLGFHLPGEIMGLDALKEDRHLCSAVALDTAHVCALPFTQLQALSQRLPSLNRYLFRLLSQEVANDHELLLWLGAKSAPERLANFLLGFAGRMQRRGLSATHFTLPMTRHELANHLGLTPETVSRTLSQMQKDGLIKLAAKDIELLNPLLLAQIQGTACHANNRSVG
jgi:CRP/FNR family transcriptional regulator